MAMRTAGLVLLITVSVGFSQTEDHVVDDSVREWSKEWTAAQKKSLGERDDVLIRPGMVADRAKREVRFTAVGCGLSQGSPAEFFLVGAEGKDYESVLATPVLAAHLREGLEFIGMKAGLPFDPSVNRYWAKGERVMVNVEWQDGAETFRVPLEQMVLSARNEGALEPAGFVFTGSSWRTTPDGRKVFNADESGDIIANFNDYFALLDLPYRLARGEQYNELTANPEYVPDTRERVTVVMTPEYGAEKRRVREYRLRVAMSPDAATAADMTFAMEARNRTPAPDEPISGPLPVVLKQVEKETQAGHDLFVEVVFDGRLPLPSVRVVCQMLNILSNTGLLRIEPVKDEPYYQAFLPAELWRDRRRRPGQPLELHFGAAPGAPGELSGTLVHVEEKYNASGSEFKTHNYSFRDLGGLKRHLDGREKWVTSAMFAFPQPGMRYEQVVSVYRLIHDRFPSFYVMLPRHREGQVPDADGP